MHWSFVFIIGDYLENLTKKYYLVLPSHTHDTPPKATPAVQQRHSSEHS